MKPTNAGVMPNASAAVCTEATNTWLTSATSTVTAANVISARPIGQGSSCSPSALPLANTSLWVFREKSMPSA